jgi:hypothetical protein
MEITGCRRTILIRRIELRPSDSIIHLKLQKTVSYQSRVFAMTVTKAQGQTSQRFAICPPSPVFHPCQLYVAYSRYSSFYNVAVAGIEMH